MESKAFMSRPVELHSPCLRNSKGQSKHLTLLYSVISSCTLVCLGEDQYNPESESSYIPSFSGVVLICRGLQEVVQNLTIANSVGFEYS